MWGKVTLPFFVYPDARGSQAKYEYDESDRVTKVESEPESGKVYRNEYEEDRLKKVKNTTLQEAEAIWDTDSSTTGWAGNRRSMWGNRSCRRTCTEKTGAGC